ncbi:PREDICTED: protein TIFY 5B-like [Camelina sativa]|uniref:Protein TIFY n=1 Tax=Camelina sativa TaxID=90675 RepID=A0ABM0Z330_CAMSA|nr:PREDICTED: protein TIFY 5B-like [Camelina sativa]
MEMQTKCDLELRLSPSSYDSDFNTSVEESSSSEISQPKQESQMLTIFYNGHMCISSDLTNLEAKAILSLASRDVGSSLRSSNGSDPSPMITNNITTIHRQKASMKRSLRSFLQKRNVRIQATCPYHRSR